MRFSRGWMRSGNAVDIILLLVLMGLCFILFSRWIDNEPNLNKEITTNSRAINHRYQSRNHFPRERSSNDLSLIKKTKLSHKKKVEKLIDERVKNMADARSNDCKNEIFNGGLTVSIIITFFDYQFFDLKTTMASIMDRTDLKLVREIILVDDGSTLDYIKNEVSTLILQHKELLILHRLSMRRGISAARLEGAKIASGDMLVFLDTNTVVNTGWLPPLIAIIKQESKTIAVPHYDSIQDPVTYRYQTTPSLFVHTINWDMSISASASSESSITTKPFYSPAVRSNVFAIKADFFRMIGEFTLMKDAPAEMVEFSLRTWLCGGIIKTSPCSRIGILNYYEDQTPYNKDSIQLVIEFWLKQYKVLMCNTLNIDCTQESKTLQQHLTRKKNLQLKCRDFSYFLNEAAPLLPWPQPSSLRFGLLRVASRSCMREADDSRLDLVDCNPDKDTKSYPREMMFEFTSNHRLLVGGKCVSLNSNAYIVASPCANNVKETERWELNNDGYLKNIKHGICAMHVTDPDKKFPRRQIVMGQYCNSIGEKEEKFVKWEVIIR